MSKNEILEIIEAVENINEDLEKQLKESDGDIYIGWSHLTIKILANSYRVGIAGVNIWFSDNDEREWIEEIDTPGASIGKYEDLELYLRKKINEIIQKIGEIQL